MRVEKEPKKVYFTTHHMVGDNAKIDIIDYGANVVARLTDCPRRKICEGASFNDALQNLNKLGYRNLKRLSFTVSTNIKLTRDDEENQKTEDNPV